MFKNMTGRTWPLQLVIIALVVSGIAFNRTRANSLGSKSSSPLNSGATAGSKPFDGVVILYSSLPGTSRDQTLRFKFFNPRLEGESDAQAIPVQVSLTDAAGNTVAESREITVAPGGFGVIDFKRADINLPGDSLTGRTETTAKLRTVPLWGLRARGRLFIQVIDDLTGKTTVGGEATLGNFVGVE
jgi:hypothetical protein